MKFILGILISICFLINPITVLAHGGVENSTNTTIVSFNQNPLSPRVNENVRMFFTFMDKTKEKRLKNLTVTLSVIDTYYGDESKDTVVLTKEMKTDINGSIEFNYAFSKENIFDIDLDFKNTNGVDENVGFLVLPRNHLASSKSKNELLVLGMFTLGMILGAGLTKIVLTKKKL